MALAKAGFVLGIKPVAALRPHEATIPAHVSGLAADMKREGVQKDPIIIDRESLTILDGMHRLAAFEGLGIENAVCCSVDYSSRSIGLARWARVYSMPASGVQSVLRDFGLTRRATFADAFDALDGRDAGIALMSPDSANLPDGSMDVDRAMDVVKSLDERAEANGWRRTFVPEDDVDVPLQSEGKVVVLMMKLRKDDVVRAASSGRLLPCKTSMHRIDPRPVAVNFPISKLNDADTPALRSWLEGSKERLLPPNSLYGGRRYKERLLLLNQG